MKILLNNRSIRQRAKRVAKLRHRKFLTGFTVIEIIITIALLSFGILGIYSFFHPASLLASEFSFRIAASQLAQEGLEVVRNIRDSNVKKGFLWSTGLLVCSDGCQADYQTFINGSLDQLPSYQDTFLKINADGFYSYETGSDTLFKRKITITSMDADSLRVEVAVTWNYHNKPFTFNTISYLYNY